MLLSSSRSLISKSLSKVLRVTRCVRRAIQSFFSILEIAKKINPGWNWSCRENAYLSSTEKETNACYEQHTSAYTAYSETNRQNCETQSDYTHTPSVSSRSASFTFLMLIFSFKPTPPLFLLLQQIIRPSNKNTWRSLLSLGCKNKIQIYKLTSSIPNISMNTMYVALKCYLQPCLIPRRWRGGNKQKDVIKICLSSCVGATFDMHWDQSGS